MKSYPLAVIIATKDRHLALKYTALPSLARSCFRQFLTIVWDAGENNLAWQGVEKFSGELHLDYVKAPRVGLPSQRNDAINYILAKHPLVQYILFIDDDSRLSPDAIEGVMSTFAEYPDVWGVHIPIHDSNYPYNDANTYDDGKYALPPNGESAESRRFVKPYAVVGALPPDNNNTFTEWTQGCGMAFRREVFTELGMRFNEDLQRFGGYALAEDVFFSTELRCKRNKKLWSSIHGYLCHLESPGGRVDEEKRVASELYNLRLLFDMQNENIGMGFYLWRLFRFKFGRLSRLGAQCQLYPVKTCWNGFLMARKAYAEYKRKHVTKKREREPDNQVPSRFK